ncbi:hypothetical protein L596_012219 [Steinernema carpocapsae]|uniref:Homeobox domain-containing protein n=1 Tax=Steinernema carpocapsae TaxID=34508 RepID=A0A4U5NWB6_STECR|nr:hypothetical protein L596_012219 [Steinernema carpocapsae]
MGCLIHIDLMDGEHCEQTLRVVKRFTGTPDINTLVTSVTEELNINVPFKVSKFSTEFNCFVGVSPQNLHSRFCESGDVYKISIQNRFLEELPTPALEFKKGRLCPGPNYQPVVTDPVQSAQPVPTIRLVPTNIPPAIPEGSVLQDERVVVGTLGSAQNCVVVERPSSQQRQEVSDTQPELSTLQKLLLEPDPKLAQPNPRPPTSFYAVTAQAEPIPSTSGHATTIQEALAPLFSTPVHPAHNFVQTAVPSPSVLSQMLSAGTSSQSSELQNPQTFGESWTNLGQAGTSVAVPSIKSSEITVGKFLGVNYRQRRRGNISLKTASKPSRTVDHGNVNSDPSNRALPANVVCVIPEILKEAVVAETIQAFPRTFSFQALTTTTKATTEKESNLNSTTNGFIPNPATSQRSTAATSMSLPRSRISVHTQPPIENITLSVSFEKRQTLRSRFDMLSKDRSHIKKVFAEPVYKKVFAHLLAISPIPAQATVPCTSNPLRTGAKQSKTIPATTVFRPSSNQATVLTDPPVENVTISVFIEKKRKLKSKSDMVTEDSLHVKGVLAQPVNETVTCSFLAASITSITPCLPSTFTSTQGIAEKRRKRKITLSENDFYNDGSVKKKVLDPTDAGLENEPQPSTSSSEPVDQELIIISSNKSSKRTVFSAKELRKLSYVAKGLGGTPDNEQLIRLANSVLKALSTENAEEEELVSYSEGGERKLAKPEEEEVLVLEDVTPHESHQNVILEDVSSPESPKRFTALVIPKPEDPSPPNPSSDVEPEKEKEKKRLEVFRAFLKSEAKKDPFPTDHKIEKMAKTYIVPPDEVKKWFIEYRGFYKIPSPPTTQNAAQTVNSDQPHLSEQPAVSSSSALSSPSVPRKNSVETRTWPAEDNLSPRESVPSPEVFQSSVTAQTITQAVDCEMYSQVSEQPKATSSFKLHNGSIFITDRKSRKRPAERESSPKEDQRAPIAVQQENSSSSVTLKNVDSAVNSRAQSHLSEQPKVISSKGTDQIAVKQKNGPVASSSPSVPSIKDEPRAPDQPETANAPERRLKLNHVDQIFLQRYRIMNPCPGEGALDKIAKIRGLALSVVKEWFAKQNGAHTYENIELSSSKALTEFQNASSTATDFNRKLMNGEDREMLKLQVHRNAWPSNHEMAKISMARKLNLGVIRNWFCNFRVSHGLPSTAPILRIHLDDKDKSFLLDFIEKNPSPSKSQLGKVACERGIAHHVVTNWFVQFQMTEKKKLGKKIAEDSITQKLEDPEDDAPFPIAAELAGRLSLNDADRAFLLSFAQKNPSPSESEMVEFGRIHELHPNVIRVWLSKFRLSRPLTLPPAIPQTSNGRKASKATKTPEGRMSLKDEDRTFLHTYLKSTPCPNKAEIANIAQKRGLAQLVVKNWFNNVKLAQQSSKGQGSSKRPQTVTTERTSLTYEDRASLSNYVRMDSKPSEAEFAKIAKKHGIALHVISNWFNNFQLVQNRAQQAQKRNHEDENPGTSAKRMKFDESRKPSPEPIKDRKMTDEDKIALRTFAAKDAFPNANQITKISNKLKLSRHTVNSWFLNYQTAQRIARTTKKPKGPGQPSGDKTEPSTNANLTPLDSKPSAFKMPSEKLVPLAKPPAPAEEDSQELIEFAVLESVAPRCSSFPKSFSVDSTPVTPNGNANWTPLGKRKPSTSSPKSSTSNTPPEPGTLNAMATSSTFSSSQISPPPSILTPSSPSTKTQTIASPRDLTWEEQNLVKDLAIYNPNPSYDQIVTMSDGYSLPLQALNKWFLKQNKKSSPSSSLSDRITLVNTAEKPRSSSSKSKPPNPLKDLLESRPSTSSSSSSFRSELSSSISSRSKESRSTENPKPILNGRVEKKPVLRSKLTPEDRTHLTKETKKNPKPEENDFKAMSQKYRLEIESIRNWFVSYQHYF